MPVSAHPFDEYAWYDISMNILKNGALSLVFSTIVVAFWAAEPVRIGL